MDILILHAWGLSGRHYENLVSELKKYGHRVYIPDLAGIGKAKPPQKPFQLTDYVNFVLDYARDKSLNHFVLIGHSFGGRVAIKLAAEHPERVEKLILSGVPGILAVSKFKVYFFLILAKIGKFIFSLPLLNYFSDLGKKLLYKLAGAFDYYQTQGIMRQTFKKIIREDLVSSMRKIKSSTLLIWGEKDKITPLSIAEKMSQEIKGARLIVVAGAGHNLPYKKPKLFVKKIIGVLS